MSDKVNRHGSALFARLEAACPEGHSILIGRAKSMVDLRTGDVITGGFRPATGRGSTRIEGGIPFARYVPTTEGS